MNARTRIRKTKGIMALNKHLEFKSRERDARTIGAPQVVIDFYNGENQKYYKEYRKYVNIIIWTYGA